MAFLPADPVHRRSVELVASVAGVVGLLVIVFFVVRERPPIPACFIDLTPKQRSALEQFRAGATPIHVLAAAILLLALARTSTARHAARHGGRHPGAVTLGALVCYGALLATTLVEPGALAVAGAVQAFFAFATFPLVALGLLIASILLVARSTRRHGVWCALAAGWGALLLVVPVIYAVVWLDPTPFCMS